jgi:large subunit ribosomal protein L17
LTTTLARAKALKPVVEKLVTLGKKGGLDRIRKAGSYLFRKDATKKLFDELGPRYADRPGGYTRILKLGTRVSDGAQMAQIEFVKNAAAKK